MKPSAYEDRLLLLNKVTKQVVAEWEARLTIVQCGVEIWANVCLYVCNWAPRVNYAYKLLHGTVHSTCSIKHFARFVAVLIIWRNTDEMSPKSSETTDGRVIGRGEWLPTSWRHTYVAPSIWQVNPSGMLEKLRNTGSKPTFESIYRY